MKKKLITLFLFAVLGMLILAGICRAESISNLYEQLKDENQGYINKLISNGATEEQIENFVNDLESRLSGVTLTEENFKSRLLNAALSIAENHKEVVNAIAKSYPESVDEVLSGKVPSGFEPLYNTIKDRLVKDEQQSPGGSGGTGGSAISTPQEEVPVNEEDSAAQEDAGECKFTDIDGHWAQKEITAMAEAGIVRGMTREQFEPGLQVTRAQFAAMLLRLLGIEENPAGAAIFRDVGPGAWYRGAVGAAVREGLINGYNENAFGPEDIITREQMAVILARVLEKRANVEPGGIALSGGLDVFKDRADISPWAREGVAKMVRYGLMAGRQKDKFIPRGGASRAEAAVLLYRLQAYLD